MNGRTSWHGRRHGGRPEALTDVTLVITLVLNGNIDIDISKIIDFHSEADRFSFRSKDSLTLKKKYSRTNVLKYSFFHRITDQWNQLPLDIRVSDNINILELRNVLVISK